MEELLDVDLCLPWSVLNEVAEQCTEEDDSTESLVDADLSPRRPSV